MNAIYVFYVVVRCVSATATTSVSSMRVSSARIFAWSLLLKLNSILCSHIGNSVLFPFGPFYVTHFFTSAPLLSARRHLSSVRFCRVFRLHTHTLTYDKQCLFFFVAATIGLGWRTTMRTNLFHYVAIDDDVYDIRGGILFTSQLDAAMNDKLELWIWIHTECNTNSTQSSALFFLSSFSPIASLSFSTPLALILHFHRLFEVIAQPVRRSNKKAISDLWKTPDAVGPSWIDTMPAETHHRIIM